MLESKKISLMIVFFFRVLAELNQRPIDFIEIESELASGFNIEFNILEEGLH